MRKEKKIFLNGKFLPERQASISVLQPAFLYGWGLFETMRAYNKNILYLNTHLRRLEKSSVLLGIELAYTCRKIKSLIEKTVSMNGFKDTYVRLSLWKQDRGTGICISAKPYLAFPARVYARGFSACISTFVQNETSILSRIKSANYLLFMLAYQQAKRRGFDEAIILNSRGYIAECSRSNIFLVKAEELFTPSLDCGCLDGITRKIVLKLAKKFHIKACELNLTPQELKESDEAFLTNSLMGIMPLVSLEGMPINKGSSGKMTRLFIKEYNSLLKNAIQEDNSTI